MTESILYFFGFFVVGVIVGALIAIAIEDEEF